jgi:hypothetical protein
MVVCTKICSQNRIQIRVYLVEPEEDEVLPFPFFVVVGLTLWLF